MQNLTGIKSGPMGGGRGGEPGTLFGKKSPLNGARWVIQQDVNAVKIYHHKDHWWVENPFCLMGKRAAQLERWE